MLARKKTLGPMKLTDVDRLEVVWNYWRKRFFAFLLQGIKTTNGLSIHPITTRQINLLIKCHCQLLNI
jgi:hypothetical protein